MGKALEKQTKAIKDQGEKQIKAIQDNKEQLVNINNDNDYKNKLLFSRERKILRNIYNKRLDKIEELSKKIDYNNLKYPSRQILVPRTSPTNVPRMSPKGPI